MTDLETHIEQIKQQIEAYQARGLKLFTTSSFQTQSVVLLHILSRIDRSIPVFFINTGFHFAETLAYRDTLIKEFGITVKDVKSDIPKSQQRDASGQLYFTSDPDYCCQINKVVPLDLAMREYDVWINGVRGAQSAVRSNFEVEEPAQHGVMRYHPILEWNAKMIYQYINQHQLPRHPMEHKGYLSIGCEPCTRKPSLEDSLDDRSGRWSGMKKTECGIHTQLVKK